MGKKNTVGQKFAWTPVRTVHMRDGERTLLLEVRHWGPWGNWAWRWDTEITIMPHPDPRNTGGYSGVTANGHTGYAWQTFRDSKLHPDSYFTAIGRRIFLTPDAFDSPAS